MDPYVISLAAGATGLMAMAVSGVAHIGAGGHGHGGHGSHVGHASHHGRGPGRTSRQGTGWLQTLLSPRVFFSLLVGFGAGGLLAEPLGEPLRVVAAVAGAALFEALLVGPLWRLLFRFE